MLKQRIQRALAQGKYVTFIFPDGHKLSITEIADEIDFPNWISCKLTKSSKIQYINLEQVSYFEIADKNPQKWSV